MCAPDSVSHAVWAQCSHHAQFLKCSLVLPLLRKLLFLWSFMLDKLLPALCRTFDVPVKVLKLFDH